MFDMLAVWRRLCFDR